MNIYALFPLVATSVYISLLVTTISSRPWQRRHKLFALFLLAAMLWSFTDYFFRSNLFPQQNFLLLKLILIIFTWTTVQFHCFASSFFPAGQGRWLPLAYASLAMAIALVAMGFIPEGIVASGGKLYPEYGKGVVFLAIPLLTLVARNLYVLWKGLKRVDNPVLYNQVASLLIGISVLTIFVLAALLPWGREFPISHLGNLINAFILSYATIRHQLVDIRFALRRWLAWLTLGTIGAAFYFFLLIILDSVLNFELNLAAAFVATIAAIIVGIIIYEMRDLFLVTVSRALGGSSYDYRQRLSDFASKIHNVFSLREQGGELLTLVTKAIGCNKACLLFLEPESGDFTTQFVEPPGKDNPLCNLKLRGHNPIAEYLRREHRPLTRVNLAILPELRSLWEREKEEIKSTEIELFVPLISRDRLVGILVLDKKQSGRYSLEDFSLLEEVTNRVAVSMEKEYLRERLTEREEELSVINRSSAILTSSLDIQIIYDSFIDELKKVVDVGWAAIVLIEENNLYFLALSSKIGSAWQVGERILIKDTATEWVATHKKTVVELDLSRESRFATGKYHLSHGVHSIVYLPLIAGGKAIGSLIVASCQPNAYSPRQIMLLEQLASQVAMPVENSRLYAEAEEKARIDELTGLLNRRSLDELLVSEINRHSRYGGVLSLIILDLDSFKAFNDHYGHLAGDKLLKQIGGTIKKAIRGADQAFRYGGDEFAILLPQTAIEAAYQVAERVRQRVTSETEKDHIVATASIGLASWPAGGIGPNQIIAVADAALYRAKRNGGNQSQHYSGTSPPSEETMVGFQDSENSEALSAIYALAATVDARDHYTRSHSKKVNEYAVALAEALNLPPLEISRLSTCAFLHDVGKIGIRDEILNKPGNLSDKEWQAIKAHPQLGAAIVGHTRHLSPCLPGILHHHERYDGTGYPEGLRGEEIPLEARILAIADAFAAMTSERPHSKALSYEQALRETKRGAGTQFDPKLVEVFLPIVKISSITATEGTTGGGEVI